MKAIADAGKKRDISIFNKTIAEYDDELKKDPVVQNHLKALYDNLLEKNLVRIIEPYSRVQIAHVAETINLPYDIVEKKLSQIILDKKFSGMCLVYLLLYQTDLLFMKPKSMSNLNCLSNYAYAVWKPHGMNPVIKKMNFIFYQEYWIKDQEC